MTVTQPPTRISTKSLILFFVLAYGITWGLSVLATGGLLPFQLPPLVMNMCSILLHYGPAVAAIIMAAVNGGRGGVKALLKRLGQWRVGWQWYLFVLFFPLFIRLAAVGLDVVMGGKLPSFFSADVVPGGNPALLLPVVFLAVFFQAGLAEEIGWRGYALPGLQQRYGALTSSLILGVIWTFWHYHPENFASIWPVTILYLLFVVSFTILITWVQNNTQANLLLAVLFHTASNVSDWIVPTFTLVSNASGMRPFVIECLLSLAAALIVIAIFGPKHLSRRVTAPGAG